MLRFEALWPLAILAGVPLIVWLARRQRTNLSGRRVAWAAALRVALLLCLMLALMRPAWQRPEQAVAVLYAVDVSHSVSSAYLRDALSAIERADEQSPPAFRRFIVFGDRVRVVERAEEIAGIAVRGPDGAAADPAARAEDGAIDQGVTDIEAALAAAVHTFPAHLERHLVLITDGHQTRGDLWRQLPRLRAERVRVFTLPAQTAVGADAWVEALDTPELLREREPFLLHARVQSRTAAAATVELRAADRVLDTQRVALTAGVNDVLFEAGLPRAGSVALSVRVSMPGDQVPGNDAMTRAVQVRPALRALHVGAPDAPLATALRRQDVRVDSIAAPALASQSLQPYDVVILDEVEPGALGGAAAARLETHVRDQGGGLVFVAGDSAYGKAGLAGGTVERLLPVKFEGKRKRKDLDLVLLIDRSYSMRGRKLEIAKTAALSTLDLLDPQHRFAVVAFDARPHDVVPLMEVGGKRRAEDLIASMAAGGQTNVYNALHRAHQLLEKSETRTKHVILLSDGVTATPPGVGGERGTTADDAERAVRASRRDFFDRWRRENPGKPLPGIEDLPPDPPAGSFEDMAAKLKRDRITVSTVALGDKPNLELLANLAHWTEGRAYVAASDNEIPGLFISEAQRLLGESLIEEPFQPLVKVNGAALTGLDFSTAPALKGFAVSRPKRFADVLLEGKRNLPLMAETRYGLGKTVAFLSDARGRWAADWLGWPGYAKLWTQVVRDAARRDAGQTLRWAVVREDDAARVTLTALTADGRHRDGLAPVARAGEATLPLRPLSPGTYGARLPLSAGRGDDVVFELLASGGIGAAEAADAGRLELRHDPAEEYRVTSADLAGLRRLAEATGGVHAPQSADIRKFHGDGGLRSTSLWWPLAALALGLYLAELFVRRWPGGLPWRRAPS